MKEQLTEGIVWKALEKQTDDRTFYKPYKLVITEDTTSTNIWMAFDTSTEPNRLANGNDERTYTGLPLQPLLWDIKIRTLMQTHIRRSIKK